MLNTITKWISASLKGLFFCGCKPEASDAMPDRNIASRNSQVTRLDNPSDVASETPKALVREKSSHSVSNGSSGDRSGMATASQDTATRGILPVGTNQPPLLRDEVLQPDMLSLEMDVQNKFAHRNTLAQYPQPASSLPGADEVESTVPSSVVEEGDETVDDQNLLVHQGIVAQSNVMPLEMDSQKLAIGRETPGSQLDVWPRQRDVAYGSPQVQVTDNNVVLPVSMVDDESHPVTPASESQGIMAQPSSAVREKLPRKEVDRDRDREVGGNQPPQIVKERLPSKARMVVEEIVENVQPSRITKVW